MYGNAIDDCSRRMSGVVMKSSLDPKSFAIFRALPLVEDNLPQVMQVVKHSQWIRVVFARLEWLRYLSAIWFIIANKKVL
jgi:hypothetical protein